MRFLKMDDNMRSVVQRVSKASVSVDGETVGQIGKGLLVLLGIHGEDQNKEIEWMAEKIINLRIFADNEGKMNLSPRDIGAEMLIVSQFTLYGDCRKGRRPGYSQAASPDVAKVLYEQFITKIEQLGIAAASGKFGAMMDVALVNDGPVTLLLDSEKNF
jgi:D-tyrosyl-tRNA(Tyr) deacylase